MSLSIEQIGEYFRCAMEQHIDFCWLQGMCNMGAVYKAQHVLVAMRACAPVDLTPSPHCISFFRRIGYNPGSTLPPPNLQTLQQLQGLHTHSVCFENLSLLVCVCKQVCGRECRHMFHSGQLRGMCMCAASDASVEECTSSRTSGTQ